MVVYPSRRSVSLETKVYLGFNEYVRVIMETLVRTFLIHDNGSASETDVSVERIRWNGATAYCDRLRCVEFVPQDEGRNGYFSVLSWFQRLILFIR